MTAFAAFAALAAVSTAGTPGPDPARTGAAAAAGSSGPAGDAGPAVGAPAPDRTTAAPSPAGTPTGRPVGTPTAATLTAPPAPEPTRHPLDEAADRARRITDATRQWASFTLVDRRIGRSVGDRRAAQPTNSESVVKAWLAADLLATRAAQRRPLSAWERSRMAAMIRVSDDNAAEVIWRMLGREASIRRMIRVCRLTDSRVHPGWWSLTQISARDMARLGACLVPGPGRLLDARTGAELLRLMRTVHKSNAFGIAEMKPGGPGVPVAVKNGWTAHGGTELWNVNCLAMWGRDLRWVLAVTVRYPIPRGLSYGAGVCRRVTRAIFP